MSSINTGGNPVYLYDDGAWNIMSDTDIVKPLDGIWIYSMDSETEVIELTYDTNPLVLPPVKDL